MVKTWWKEVGNVKYEIDFVQHSKIVVDAEDIRMERPYVILRLDLLQKIVK